MTVVISGNNGVTGATWTTATRPSSPTQGQSGYNTTTNCVDTYNGTSWTSVPQPTSQGTSGQYLQSAGAGAAPTWASVSSFSMPSGAIMPYAGSSAPADWLLCSGAAVSRTTYAALFAVVGTTYGSGDGSTTFNLPDLRGRAVAGVDNMGGTAANRITSGGSGITGTTLGAAGGAQTFTLSTNEMPSHSHSIATRNTFVTGTPFSVATSANLDDSTRNTNSAGGGGASNVTQPTIMLNYIIKT